MTRERRRTDRRGRRSGAPQVSTIYWRDIPAQLTARTEDGHHKLLLHARFQHAIDRAAGVAGLTATDDYVNEWRTESAPLPDGDDVDATLSVLCATLEAQYPRTRLEALVTAGGLDPERDERVTPPTSRSLATDQPTPTPSDDEPMTPHAGASLTGTDEPHHQQQEQP